MTWENRFRLLAGVAAVIAVVFALTLVFNHRQNQITSYAARVTAEAYTIGADHAGTVTSARVKAGDTVMFDRAPGDPIKLRCGAIDITDAIMGHIGSHVSVRVSRPLNAPKVTMAAFEAIDEKGDVRWKPVPAEAKVVAGARTGRAGCGAASRRAACCCSARRRSEET